LYFQPARQPGAWLRSLGQDRFVLAGVPAEIYFLRDDSGSVTALLWRQNGQKYHGFRHELPELPKEVELPPTALQDYVGRYSLRGGFEVTVRRTDAGLVAQAAGQIEAPIYASAENEFFYKVVDARITFIRKSHGGVSGLILKQNGQNIEGERIHQQDAEKVSSWVTG
jgi:serine-type D-Ala-D-Ala carboxypeptidase/endopeptidase